MGNSFRSVLITGASAGLGAALARSLGRRGARVVLTARNVERLEATVAGLRAEGYEAFALAADVADKQRTHAVAAAAAELAGPLDLLVHNASTLGPVPLRPLLDTECEDLERALAVNVLGPFRLTRVVAGAMALRGEGTVAFVSSDAAVEAYPTWGAYGASKAAADHLARTLAAELQGTGVRVLSVDPGEMDTAMHRDAMPDADPSALTRPQDAGERLASLLCSPRGPASGARVSLPSWTEVLA